MTRRFPFAPLAFVAAVVVAAAATAAPAFVPRAHGDHPTAAEMSDLGRVLFADARLSASGTMSCATCHDPAAAFGPGPHAASPFADGVPAHAGTRAIPSLRYLQYGQRFTEHRVEGDENARDGLDGGPSGGLTWDGRVDTVHEQARIPLFAPHEMANESARALADRLRAAPEGPAFRRAFSAAGRDVFDDPEAVVGWIGAALEAYQQDGHDFLPFSSRYDQVLRGRATLSPAEARGLAIFVDPAKGNCASCHDAARANNGAFPLFTDGGLVSLGVPRSVAREPSANAPGGGAPAVPTVDAGIDLDSAHDLGLCTSGRQPLAADPSYCGRFRTPTLRNVALRPSFFHNGAVTSLRDAVAFYATRDTDPARWYGRDAAGRVRPYDDLPSAYVAYVEKGAPFEPAADGRPRLSERDIDDVVAFLRTLTDVDARSSR